MSSLPYVHELSQITPTCMSDSIFVNPTEIMDDIVGSTCEKNLFLYSPTHPLVTDTEISQYGLMDLDQDSPYYSLPESSQQRRIQMPPSVAAGAANTYQSLESPALGSGYIPNTSNETQTPCTMTVGGDIRGNQVTQSSLYRLANVKWDGTAQIPATGSVQDSTHERGHANLALGRGGTSTLQCHWTGCTYRSRFSRDSSLWRHIKAKHLYRGKFVCPVCGKQLDRPDSLQAHRRLNGHLDESS